ncbi:MAG: DUF350 domain-containing protein [Actinomycetota bacterium]|jgi:uncharacterized membrane protein YjfL (UPF0719 family)|nr:DUF350 domain-containing protein [Actinomycetota bacterium]
MIDSTGVIGTLAYAGVGLTLLTLGYVVLDLITPGNLRHLVFADRNVNAAVVAAGNALALAAIVTTAILESDDVLVVGLVQATVYGLLGIALQAVAFKILDLVTPGHLGHIVTDPRPDPASGVVAVFTLAMGAVLSAAIT